MNNRKITMFAPSVCERFTAHKPSDIPPTLIHEINHMFYLEFAGTVLPVWLSDGLAENMARPGRKPGKIDRKYLIYAYKDTEFMQKSHEYVRQCYRNSYLFTHLLLKKKGKRSVMEFLKEFRKHKDRKTYDALFEKLCSELHVGASDQ